MTRSAAIVVSYQTGPPLWDCIAALLADPSPEEVVVVDNGNPEAVSQRLQALAEAEPRLSLLHGHGNIGFAAGCNLAVSAARDADVLAFVNPDAIVRPGAIARLVSTARDAQTRPVLAGGLICTPEGREQRGARRGDVTLWSAFVSFSGLSRLEGLHPALRDLHRDRDPLPNEAAPIPVVSGAFFAMPRVDFEALGGFDEGYFLHVEDIDLCWRTRKAGGTVLIDPRAEAVHVGATSSASPLAVQRHKAEGFHRYFKKRARGPVGRLAAAILAPLIWAAVLGPGLLRAPKRV